MKNLKEPNLINKETVNGTQETTYIYSVREYLEYHEIRAYIFKRPECLQYEMSLSMKALNEALGFKHLKTNHFSTFETAEKAMKRKILSWVNRNSKNNEILKGYLK